RSVTDNIYHSRYAIIIAYDFKINHFFILSKNPFPLMICQAAETLSLYVCSGISSSLSDKARSISFWEKKTKGFFKRILTVPKNIQNTIISTIMCNVINL